MPTPSEYDAARFRMKVHAEDSWNTGNHDDIAHYSLALRWLRVGAAMEAGTKRWGTIRALFKDERGWVAEFAHGGVVEQTAPAPDPLTAADRAMGVGNG